MTWSVRSREQGTTCPVYCFISPGVKRWEREADHSPLSNAKARMLGGGFTSPPLASALRAPEYTSLS